MSPALDLIIDNADIVTMTPERPRACRVGILFGRIVGLDEQLDGWTAARRIDAGGACLVPGLIDAHTHLELTGQALTAVDIHSCTTVASALAVIAEAAQARPDDEWIEVGGYNQNVLGRHLTAAELDAATGGRKVWVRQISSHASVVSTAVLDAAPTAAIRGNSRIAAGLLEELEQSLVYDQRMPYPVDSIGTMIAAAADQARRQGVTTCIEAGNGGNIGSLSSIDGAAFLDLHETGRLPVRVQLMPSLDVLREMNTNQQDGFRRGIALGLRGRFGSDDLGIVAQKIVLDGGMQVGTARMSQPYAGGNLGSWRQDPDDMTQAAIDGHLAGWQVAVHAIGDAAVDLAIGAFAAAQRIRPRPDARHRIEHGGVIRPDQLARLGQLGIAVVTQPAFVYDFGDQYAEQLGTARRDWLYRGRSLIEHGVRLVGSTDRPMPGSPLRAIQTLVERVTAAGQVLAPAERLSVQEALEIFTVHGAWVIGREDRLGRITARYLADLTVLADNPLLVTPGSIARIPILGTVVNGTVWWPSPLPASAS